MNSYKQQFCLASFCYGDRYYKQVNRLIESIKTLGENVCIFIVTDNPDEINKYDFVYARNITYYNDSYTQYKTNYYDFDFSVKRFSLLYAFEMGYNNVILTDADAIINPFNYSSDKISECFNSNTICGSTCYNFHNEIKTKSMLGNRFLYYEKKFNVCFDKNNLITMPEDCIQFISICDDDKFNFIDTWNKCIEVKYQDKLINIPAGNIDEMCFSALSNNIKLKNIPDNNVNLIVAKHDKWY